jgi:hypothetical protein
MLTNLIAVTTSDSVPTLDAACSNNKVPRGANTIFHFVVECTDFEKPLFQLWFWNIYEVKSL